jgi:acyl-CoA thioester hydrolase
MTIEPSKLTSEFPCLVEQDVLWGDMDAMGHVNNAVYFRYFESARIAYFEATGFLEQMDDNGIGPILAHTDCRFRIPLTYPDRLRIGARVTAVGDDRLQMNYRVVSTRSAAVAAEGTGRIVCFDYRAGAKAPLPDSVRSAIAKYEGRDLESMPWPP